MQLYVAIAEVIKNVKRKRRKCKRYLKGQKKIIIIVLFIILLGLSFGYSAFSTNINFSAKGNVYKVSDKCYKTSDNGDGTVTITDYDKTCGSEVNIPSVIRGKKVTKIGDKAFQSREITKVVLPNTLTEVGTFAFHLNKLESLILPASTKIVGNYAFEYNRIKYLKLNEG